MKDIGTMAREYGAGMADALSGEAYIDVKGMAERTYLAGAEGARLWHDPAEDMPEEYEDVLVRYIDLRTGVDKIGVAWLGERGEWQSWDKAVAAWHVTEWSSI